MIERLLDYRGIRREFTLSESTVRRLVADGKFPQPERLTRGRVVFREDQVRSAVERLLAANNGSGSTEAKSAPEAAA
jgi:predicted DNA-binding transcriptional regulator AlpA